MTTDEAVETISDSLKVLRIIASTRAVRHYEASKMNTVQCCICGELFSMTEDTLIEIAEIPGCEGFQGKVVLRATCKDCETKEEKAQ